MTRWLVAARQARERATEPTQPKHAPAREVSSVLSVLSGEGWAEAAADALKGRAAENPDARAYLAHLMAQGPSTVGAAASALGWGATRAWRAEAVLRGAGRVAYGPLGRAEVVSDAKDEAALRRDG